MKTAAGVIGLALTSLMASLDTSIANVGLPTIARALGASFSQVQWIVLAYLLTLTALIVSAGRLGDLMGRRRMLLGGITIFMLGSVSAAFAPSLGVLIAARVVQGLGAASMMALSMAFVTEVVSKEKSARVMGLLSTVSAIGTALGPTLGGLMIANLGWRSIFMVSLPLGAAALFLILRLIPSDTSRESASGRFDAVGTVLLASALTMYALAMTLGRASFGILNLALLAGSVIAVIAFLAYEARSSNPLLKLQMFCNPERSASLISSTLVSTVMMSTLVVGPFYLSRALGLSPALTGLILSAGPVVVVLFGVPAGRLAELFGSRVVSKVGLGLMALGTLSMSLTSREFGIAGFLLPVIVLTAGYALFQTSNNALVMADVSADERGVVSGILSLSRNLGLVTGASAMGAVFSLASGAADVAQADPTAVHRGLQITFAVAAGLILFALKPRIGTLQRRLCRSM